MHVHTVTVSHVPNFISLPIFSKNFSKQWSGNQELGFFLHISKYFSCPDKILLAMVFEPLIFTRRLLSVTKCLWHGWPTVSSVCQPSTDRLHILPHCTLYVCDNNIHVYD